MGQEKKSSAVPPKLAQSAHFARTIMRSAGITAAAAVDCYSPFRFSLRPRKSIHLSRHNRDHTTRGSLCALSKATLLTQRFELVCYFTTGFAVCQPLFYKARIHSLRRPYPSRPRCTWASMASRSRFSVPFSVR